MKATMAEEQDFDGLTEPPASKECSACGETILAEAKKCRFCGVFFDRALQRRQRATAPAVGVDREEAASSLATLLSIPGFVVCFGHVCMAGHWDHAPYPFWHWITEGAWVIGFVLAIFFALGSSTARRFARAGTLGVLLVGRLFLGGLGGTMFIVDAPALLILGGASLVSGVRWLRRPR